MKKKLPFIILGLAVLFAGYLFSLKNEMSLLISPAQAQEGMAKSVSSQELNAMLAKKDFFFVNVHVPYEGEIANTDAFIPFSEVEKNLGTLPKDKNAKIVLYCRSGRMSAIAAQTLVSLGYTNVYDLAGGMNAWKAQGYKIIEK